MTDADSAASPDLPKALGLLAEALRRLAENSSAETLHCANQTRAALDALLTVVSEPERQRAISREVHDNPAAPGMDDIRALLVGAERIVSGLPAHLRNQTAVCAAMAYLRRGRRALVLP